MASKEIREKCGKPDLVRTIEKPILARAAAGGTIQTGVEVTLLWYYERGSNQYVARVTIRDAMAEEIEILNVKDVGSLKDEQ
jgi:hypothetical protein